MEVHPEAGDSNLKSKALHIADILSSLAPDECDLVLYEARKIVQESKGVGCAEDETQSSTMLQISQWLSRVFLRLSPPAQAGLLEVAKHLDEAERFERLVDSQD